MNYLLILILVLISNSNVSCEVCQDCSNIWNSAPYPRVYEEAEIGQFNETKCLGNIQNIKWSDDSKIANEYLEFVIGANFSAIKVKKDLSLIVDCDVSMASEGQNLKLIGTANFECSEKKDEPLDNFLYIVNTNNRAPEFNENAYYIENVSRRLPKGLDLFLVYEIEAWVQDMDHNSFGQVDDINSIKVINAAYDIFEANFDADIITKPAPICSDVRNETSNMFKSHRISLKLINDFPLGIETPYIITLESMDTTGNTATATVSITFIDEDLLPPVFVTEEFDFHIDDPAYTGNDVQIYEFEAVDGDTSIDTNINYILSKQPDNCVDCFNLTLIDGILYWIKEIPKDVIEQRMLSFDICAFQENDPNKNVTNTVTITFPGDETPPQFDKPEYVGTLMFDGTIELDTQIKAKDGDAYLDTEVSYALSGSSMFKIDETSGGVSVTDTFNANDLPINEIVLYIKAFQIDKPNDRYGTVNLKLSYDYNKEPPVFNVNSIIIHVNETGTLTKPGQIKATNTDFPEVLPKYKLVDDFNGRYSLGNFDDNSVELILNALPDTDTEIIMIRAIEENVIPERIATLPIVINLVHEYEPLSTTTLTTPTSTSTTSTTITPTTSPTTATITTSSTSTPTPTPTTPTTSTSPTTTSTSSSPPPCTSRFDQTVYDGDSFTIVEGSEEESHNFVNCGNNVHSQSTCPGQTTMEYSVISISPPMFENYIKLNKTSGSFICAKIYENIPDASLPEKMSLQVTDGNGAEAVVFFKIQKTNNHPPQIEPYQFQLIPIIGYPNFIWMDYPVQIPILRMKWSDWDSMDNISVSLEEESNGNSFWINSDEGDLYLRDAEYFSQQKQLRIKADDGKHQADYSLTIVPLSKGNVIPIRINKTVDASKFVYQLNNNLNANETYSIRLLKSEMRDENQILFVTIVHVVSQYKTEAWWVLPEWFRYSTEQLISFLDVSEAKMFLQNMAIVDEDIDINTPPLDQENSDLTSVFIALFATLLVINLSIVTYWLSKKYRLLRKIKGTIRRRTSKHKGNTDLNIEPIQQESRFDDIAMSIKKSQKNDIVDNSTAPPLEKSIKFNENAEVILKDSAYSNEDSEDDIESTQI